MIAASLANREQLLLYFKTGEMLSEKITSQKWGSKVVEQIAEDLQTQLPGLKGFSRRNLLYMRQFYHTYQDFLIVRSATALLLWYLNNNIISPYSFLRFLYPCLVLTIPAEVFLPSIWHRHLMV